MKGSKMSNSDGKVNVSGGIGLGGLVFCVLLVLKLTGLVQLSWFWVFFPLWIVPAVLTGLGLIFLLVYVVLKLKASMPGKRLK